MATQNQPDIRVRLSAEGVREVVAALQQVQQAANQASRQTANVGSSMQSAASGVSALTAGVKALALAAAGLAVLDKVRDFGARGLSENKAYEQASLGIAAVIASQTDLIDSQGRLLTGQEAYSAAVQKSETFLAGLQGRLAGTSLDFGTLAEASRNIVFSGISAGVTDLDKLQELTVVAASAMQVLGMDVAGVGEEVAGMLKGEDSKLLKSLGIPSEVAQSWKLQGTLVDNLSKRLQGFATYSDEAANSFDGLAKRADIAFGDISGSATKSLFDKLKSGMSDALKGIYDSAGNLSPALQPVVNLLDRVGGALGTLAADAMTGLVDGAKRFGTFLNENSSTVDAISSGIAAVYGGLKGIAKSLSGILGDMKTGPVATTLWTTATNTLAVALAMVADGVDMVRYGVNQLASLPFKVAGLFGSDAGQQIGQQLNDQANAIIEKGTRIEQVFKQIAATGKAITLPAANDQAAPAAAPANSASAADAALRQKFEQQRVAAEKLAKAQAEAARAAKEAEYKEVQAKNALILAQEQAAYDAGLASLQDYYAKRKQLAESEGAAERAALQAKLDAAKALPALDPVQQAERSKAIRDAQAALTVQEYAQKQRLFALEKERGDAEKQRILDEIDLRKQLADIAGLQGEAAQAAIDAEIAKLDQLLQKMGSTAAEREKLLAEARSKKEAGSKFDLADNKLSQIDADYERRKSSVNIQAQTGVISEVEANQRVMQLERERISIVSELTAQMQQLAEASGDSNRIEKIAEYNKKLAESRASTDAWGKSAATLKNGAISALESGMNNFANSVLQGTMSAKEAFAQMALSIVQSIQQIIVQLMIKKAIEAAFGAPALAEGGLVGGSGGKTKAFATGGFVSGPGTGTSDSIPAWLSNGEYVIPAHVVAQPGMLSMLEQLRKSGRMPSPSLPRTNSAAGVARFADGGLVGSLKSSSGTSTNSSLTVGLEDGLVLKELRTPAGQRAVVELLSNNKRSVRQAIS